MVKISGKRTYMVALGSVLTTVGAWMSGELELGTMISVVTTSLLAVFLRKGIKSAEASTGDPVAE